MKASEKLMWTVLGYAALLGFIGGWFSFLGSPGFGSLKALCGVFIGRQMFWPLFLPKIMEHAINAHFEEDPNKSHDTLIKEYPTVSKIVKRIKRFFNTRN